MTSRLWRRTQYIRNKWAAAGAVAAAAVDDVAPMINKIKKILLANSMKHSR